jgi:hypothetical protein
MSSSSNVIYAKTYTEQIDLLDKLIKNNNSNIQYFYRTLFDILKILISYRLIKIDVLEVKYDFDDNDKKNTNQSVIAIDELVDLSRINSIHNNVSKLFINWDLTDNNNKLYIKLELYE